MDTLAGLSPVSSSTRREEVVRALRRAILTGELQAGDHLREVALAERLGVSRPTVRESMRQLIQEGLLTQEPYRGTRVVEPQPETLLEIADVRSALEALAARKAAARGAELLREPFAKALADLEQAATSGDQSLMHEAHVSFHGLVYTASGSQLLEQVWNLIHARIAFAVAWDQMAYPDSAWGERQLQRHRAIVTAIMGGDAASIDRVVNEHIGAAARDVVDRVNRVQGRRGGRLPSA
jgi:DNA-binding GntR family transcriptional regulator